MNNDIVKNKQESQEKIINNSSILEKQIYNHNFDILDYI